MRNLIALELKRNRLRPYHIATLICGVTMLGFQYLMAAIPYMDPTEPDAELFSQYPFLMGITCLVCMAIFLILSAVMASRFVVEEYSGKRAILLLSYPISRKKVLCAKLMLVFAYKNTRHGTAEGIRTPDLLVRSQSLYPAELQPLVASKKNLPDS